MSSTKERILAVERILLRRKSVSTQELRTALLNEYGIEANRRSIYDDMAVLTRFLPIELERGAGKARYVIREEDSLS